MVEYSELERIVRRRLPEELYQHCVATGQAAYDLATYHGFDSQKARAAGLLHDIARSLDDGKLIHEAERLGVVVSESDRTAPVLLHGRVGAKVVEKELGITDPQVIEAIAVHTTGAPGMSAIARLVFVADYAEPARDLAGAEEIRALLPERLDEAVLAIVGYKIDYVMESGAVVDPRCLELRDELVRKMAGRQEPS